MDDIEKLEFALKNQFTNIHLIDDFGWKCPPLDVLDCALSLNRRYKAFVLPRVYKFKEQHPDVTLLFQLKEIIQRYEKPVLFSIQELNYNDAARAETIKGVVEYLIQEQFKYSGKTEYERLHKWAIAVHPTDVYVIGIKGFGIAGFQYLRMLLGAQTTKPDTHIKNFISDVIGRSVNQEVAIQLLEQAARNIGLPVRQIDNIIWKERSKYMGG